MSHEKTPLLSNNGTDPKDGSDGPKKLPRRSSASQNRYPDPCYDPRTKKLMKNPVVAPDGISFERSTWKAIRKEKTKVSAPAYDNRALRQVIEEAILLSEDLRQKELRRKHFRRSTQIFGQKLQKSVRWSIAKLADKSILPTDDFKVLSTAYYCPITMALMKEPVIGPEGYTFERDAIEQWIDKNQVSPLTRTPLPSKQLLYPNLALKEMLRLEATKMEEKDQNQSVRDYKSSMMMKQQPEDEEGQQQAYRGPNTLEEWEALRHERRQSNVVLTLQGMLRFLCLMLLVVFGFVVGLVLGALVLVLATLLDLLVVPCLQCFSPGGYHGQADFGDDELPFIFQAPRSSIWWQ